jgi:carbon storage regulator
MLVVTRKSGESILIGDNIEIFILDAGDGCVKIGINAPKNIRVLRKELIGEVREQNIESLNDIEKIIKLKK